MGLSFTWRPTKRISLVISQIICSERPKRFLFKSIFIFFFSTKTITNWFFFLSKPFFFGLRFKTFLKNSLVLSTPASNWFMRVEIMSSDLVAYLFVALKKNIDLEPTFHWRICSESHKNGNAATFFPHQISPEPKPNIINAPLLHHRFVFFFFSDIYLPHSQCLPNFISYCFRSCFFLSLQNKYLHKLFECSH